MVTTFRLICIAKQCNEVHLKHPMSYRFVHNVSYTHQFVNYFNSFRVATCLHSNTIIIIHKRGVRVPLLVTDSKMRTRRSYSLTSFSQGNYCDVTFNYLRHYMQDHFFLKFEQVAKSPKSAKLPSRAQAKCGSP